MEPMVLRPRQPRQLVVGPMALRPGIDPTLDRWGKSCLRAMRSQRIWMMRNRRDQLGPILRERPSQGACTSWPGKENEQTGAGSIHSLLRVARIPVRATFYILIVKLCRRVLWAPTILQHTPLRAKRSSAERGGCGWLPAPQGLLGLFIFVSWWAACAARQPLHAQGLGGRGQTRREPGRRGTLVRPYARGVHQKGRRTPSGVRGWGWSAGGRGTLSPPLPLPARPSPSLSPVVSPPLPRR